MARPKGRTPRSRRRLRAPRASLLPLLGGELVVDRLDEHVCRPWAGVGSVLTPVSGRRIGRLQLRERLSFVEESLNAVANDGDRVAIFEEIELVVHEAVSGHEQRTVRLPLKRDIEDAQIHQTVQRVDLT